MMTLSVKTGSHKEKREENLSLFIFIVKEGLEYFRAQQECEY